MPSTAMLPLSSFGAVAQTLADHGALPSLLPRLHEQAIEAVGGRGSLLLQLDTRTGLLHPTSAHGLELTPREPWSAGSPEMRYAEDAFSTGKTIVVTDLDRRLPRLASDFRAPSALFVPLLQAQEAVGLVVVGLGERQAEPDAAARERAGWIGYAFVIALERARLRREAEVQRAIREILDTFSRIASSALNLVTGLEACCREAGQLFAAERASVWLHDRRSREVVLAASSDPADGADRAPRIAADSDQAPAALALRRDRAAVATGFPAGAASRVGSTITVPLRGRRRALGVLVLEGTRIDPGGELDLLDDADELGRQLSAAIENVQLLEDVIRSRRELESTVNSVPDLVAVCDTSLRIVQVNRAFAERLGVGRDQAVSRLLPELVGLEAGTWIRSLDVWGGSGAGQTFTRELDDAVLEGRHAFTVTPLIGPDGNALGAVVVARDLTRQARLEAERAALRDRLTESEKLAVLGQFVAGVAHELNNPLQSVLGHLELLRRHPGIPREIDDDLRVVVREANRAARVVGDLLVFAGRRRASGRRVNLNALLTRIMGRRRVEAGPGDGPIVVADFDPALPLIEGDALRLRQALANVLVNAQQAAGPGGQVQVRTRYWAPRNVVVVEVQDNGPGIPEEALPRLFEPFFTTRQAGRGTGLGLTITYGVVRDHGGQVLAANHQAGGALITIELPVGGKSRTEA